MARTGYPTTDLAQAGTITATPVGGTFASKVDDDGDNSDYVSLVSNAAAIEWGFAPFGALPASSTTISLFIYAYWSGAVPGTVTFGLKEGSIARGSLTQVLSTSNIPYGIDVSAGSFSSVADLRATVARQFDGTGSAVVTGVVILMEDEPVAHLKLVGGQLQQVSGSVVGEIHLNGGQLIASSNAGTSGSLTLDAGFFEVIA